MIALVNRGGCTFMEKATQAQNAGARGLLVANNDTQSPDAVLGGLSGLEASITIGVGLVSYNLGQSLRGAPSTPTVRLISYPDADGGLDSELVAHEWGHYMFERLTGSTASNQRSAIHEGNGDFVALLMSVRDEQRQVVGNDQWQGAFPLVTYAGRRHDFGPRRYPYSTDFATNPLTPAHIDDSEELPTGVPTSPNPSSNSEVHNSGEVWATIMWECYAGLLKTHPFPVARDRMLGYEVAGLSMFPPAVTFTEARDAMLAPMLATDRSDFDVCWRAFARRGLGVGAVAPSRFSEDHLGVVESYDIRGEIGFRDAEIVEVPGSCDEDGYLDEGELGEMRATLINTGAAAISATEVRLFLPSAGNAGIPRPGVTFPNGDTVQVPPLEPHEQATVAV